MFSCSYERHAYLTTMGKEYQNLLEVTTIESMDEPIDGSCQGQAANQFGLVHGHEQRNIPLKEDPRT